MVASMEVDKVVEMVADEKEKEKKGNTKKKKKKGYPMCWSQGLVIWVETFSTRSLPDLRVF